MLAHAKRIGREALHSDALGLVAQLVARTSWNVIAFRVVSLANSPARSAPAGYGSSAQPEAQVGSDATSLGPVVMSAVRFRGAPPVASINMMSLPVS